MADKHIADALLTKTAIADEDLEGNRFVKFATGTGLEGALPHAVYADAGDAANGVTRDKISSGKLADIIYAGTAFVEAAGNIDASALVAAANDGKAQTAVGGNSINGIAAGAANTNGFVKVELGVGGVV
jgi:hypothetical protein